MVIMSELKKARMEAGYTQEQAANRLGYSRATIIAHEHGKIIVPARKLMAYARLYGVKDYRTLYPSAERLKKIHKR